MNTPETTHYYSGTFWIIMHRTGRYFMGRNGDRREMPLLFSEREHARDEMCMYAQVAEDWDVVQVTVSTQP